MGKNAPMVLTTMDRDDVTAILMMDFSMAQILRMQHSKEFRKPFIDNPYLEQITLRQVVSSPIAMCDFLQHCRSLPHCGDTALKRLCEVIKKTTVEKFG
jgi:hypothetical protein